MNFTKMQGAGNDYVYVNLFQQTLSKPEELAIAMSHRRFGIGADGLVLIAPSSVADLRMIMFNADGSESAMCGNASRCVGKYAWDHGLVKKNPLQLETGAGIKELQLFFDAAQKVKSVKVSMGEPILEAEAIPSQLKQEQVVEHNFNFGDFSLKGTLVSMGNPHFVTYVDDVKKIPVEKWGAIIENSTYFPKKINVEFVQVVSKDEVIQRTWERGSGETWACGTGASAVGVAGMLTGKTNPTVRVHLTGGELIINWEGKGQPVFMTGPAKEVFSGNWLLET
ncbi:MAG: diaminopimelate epimerase [SAR324 cluster bacterium]|uniref:Diaminopimelate epimerase n=1 Tax=SAR324 cluster bacterium TaxID=2024889 RepID=A0A2A4SSD3_9DELT|nr:MAG: diaminopimelate epimerase [SAR324 cluster bacterium]